MDRSRRRLIAALAAAPLLVGAGSAAAQQAPIKIGDINSYARFATFAVPYRNAMQLAIDEINAKGGVLGRKFDLVWRESNVSSGDATRAADELVTREHVDVLTGTLFSNVGVAVADYANQHKKLFMAAMPLTDAITMGSGNPYTFRLKASTYMLVSMLMDAVKHRDAKRWAIVAPNYEYGQSAAADFKRVLKERMPGAQVVAEQYPAIGKIDAGATVSALEQAKPDAIFSAEFASDLVQFYREGSTHGLFDKRLVVSPIIGEPEWLLPMKDEVPVGWVVTGYRPDQVDIPAHKVFVAAYEKRFKDTPRFSSVIGYIEVYMLRDAIAKAGSTDTEALIKVLPGMAFDTILGPVTLRAADHQATIGTWVGTLERQGNHGVLSGGHYLNGADFMYPEAEAIAARKH